MIAIAVLVASEAFKAGETSAKTPDFRVALSRAGERATCRVFMFNCPITPMEKMKLPRLVADHGWRWNGGDLTGVADEQEHGIPKGSTYFDMIRQPEDLLTIAEGDLQTIDIESMLRTEAWVAKEFGRASEPCRT
jgi:hypothetical protein